MSEVLLDEMLSPSIAEQLRLRGHDVGVVSERVDLRSQPDSVVFGIAQSEQRAIVTEDVADYRPLAIDALRSGNSHAGVIFTSNWMFPRANPRTTGRLVTALDAMLSAETDLTGQEYWLS